MISIDNLSDFLKDNSKKAIDAAKETVSVAKLKADRKSEEFKLSGYYTEIGKLFCEKADGEVDDDFIELLNKVSECKKKIIDLGIEEDLIMKKVTCTECGAKSPIGSKFCNECGASLASVDVEDPEDSSESECEECKEDADSEVEDACFEEAEEADAKAEDVCDKEAEEVDAKADACAKKAECCSEKAEEESTAEDNKDADK